MLSDDKNIAAQLRTYIAGFVPGAREVLEAYGYRRQRSPAWTRPGCCTQVLGDFADIDLHPSVVSATRRWATSSRSCCASSLR